jgi:hypothetical protein
MAKKRASGGHSIERVLARLGTPPGKRPGATDFAALERVTSIPASLRALWAWSNGCAGLLCRSPEYAIYDDLFSVEVAARETRLNREAAAMDRDLVAFGGEPGSGDSLVYDTKTGRIHYWDHEEGAADPEAVARSLEELLERVPSK